MSTNTTDKYIYIRTCEDAQRQAPKRLSDEFSYDGEASFNALTSGVYRDDGIFYLNGHNNTGPVLVYRRLNPHYVEKPTYDQLDRQNVELKQALAIISPAHLRHLAEGLDHMDRVAHFFYHALRNVGPLDEMQKDLRKLADAVERLLK